MMRSILFLLFCLTVTVAVCGAGPSAVFNGFVAGALLALMTRG